MQALSTGQHRVPAMALLCPASDSEVRGDHHPGPASGLFVPCFGRTGEHAQSPMRPFCGQWLRVVSPTLTGYWRLTPERVSGVSGGCGDGGTV